MKTDEALEAALEAMDAEALRTLFRAVLPGPGEASHRDLTGQRRVPRGRR